MKLSEDINLNDNVKTDAKYIKDASFAEQKSHI